MFRGKILPPVYLLICLSAQVISSIAFPLYTFNSSVSKASGFCLMAFALIWLLLSAQLFRKKSTTIMPFQESSSLITSGPFRISRNPIYLAMFLGALGLALVLGAISSLFFPFIFYRIIDRKIIPQEETMLADSFGENYTEYTQQVGRWL